MAVQRFLRITAHHAIRQTVLFFERMVSTWTMITGHWKCHQLVPVESVLDSYVDHDVTVCHELCITVRDHNLQQMKGRIKCQRTDTYNFLITRPQRCSSEGLIFPNSGRGKNSLVESLHARYHTVQAADLEQPLLSSHWSKGNKFDRWWQTHVAWMDGGTQCSIANEKDQWVLRRNSQRWDRDL